MTLSERRRLRHLKEPVFDMPPLGTVQRLGVRVGYTLAGRATTALDALGMPAPGEALVCLTAGQWSLIDLLRAILERTGPARVRLSTWTTGIRDAENVAFMVERGSITGLQVFTDDGFPAREPEYCQRIVELWGLDAVVVTTTHAKVATVRAPGWDIAVASSMNLNRNPRFENADVFHSAAVCDLFDGWFDDVARSGGRLDTERSVVRAKFDAMVGALALPRFTEKPRETREEKLARLRGQRGE